MSFSAQDVAKLRQTTGAGMMECKSALKESNGDIERSSEKRNYKKAGKNQSRKIYNEVK